jgi:quercetin dioxygenase-like cupin family protein
MAEQSYAVRKRETLAEVPGLRVRKLTLETGQSVPWHTHTEITDTFFCMEGPMVIETDNPRARHVLLAGETIAAAPGQPHYVHGVAMGPCRFIIIQGEGTYDYVAADTPVEEV